MRCSVFIYVQVIVLMGQEYNMDQSDPCARVVPFQSPMIELAIDVNSFANPRAAEVVMKLCRI